MPGLAIAAWAPLVPYAKLRAGLDDAGLGLLLLCLGAGAIFAMTVAGTLAARYGCQRVLIVAALLICATLPCLAWASPAWQLGLLLFGFGIGMGSMDCAINLQAVMVERDSDRPMMSSFHGFYSIGGLVGAAVVTGLLALGWSPLGAGMVVTLALLILLLLAGSSWRQDRTKGAVPLWICPKGGVALMGVLCFLVFLAEGSMLDWSAVFLSDVRGVASDHAGFGFVLFSLSMTCARLLGDFIIQHSGRLRIIFYGALLAAAGVLSEALVPSALVSLCSYVMIGLGIANIVPALFSLASRQKAMPESLAISAITTLGYSGVLAGPALIGFVAHATDLRVAFVGVGLALLAVAAATQRLRE